MTKKARRQNLLICLCLTAAILGVYWPVGHFEFVNFDDDHYLIQNHHLRGGLTPKGLVWAFTTSLDQWMPVTWLARMLECQCFGLNAGVHHSVNVAFHIVNSLLLFSVLNRMTSARGDEHWRRAATWRSGLVAALFALHPLHVEPVAWVTGLKDALSTCFWLLTIWAYVRYVEQLTVHSSALRAPSPADLSAVASAKAECSTPDAQRPTLNVFYGLTLLFFTLGLMAKPMLVTLPFVLLLLDYWPLGRTPWAKPAPTRVSGPAASDRARRSLSQLLIEKVPFLVLAAASCVVTYWARRSGGEVASLENVPMGTRIANVSLSYVRYLGKTFWPMRLTVFYPLDANLSLAAALGAGVGLVGITALVIWRARRQPWLATGWFWNLGTLVPVIGLVPVGGQSMADRYTYVPLVGLFLMLCWGVPGRAIERRIPKLVARVAAAMLLTVCAVLSRIQVGYWKNSETLFRHALSVTRDNWLAHNNLAGALVQTGRAKEAIGHCLQALRIKPDFAEAHYNLGVALLEMREVSAAAEHLEQALRIKPDFADAHYNLGLLLSQQSRFKEAIVHYEQALRIEPDAADVHNNLGRALAGLGRIQEAVGHFEQALRIQPDFAEAHNNLGIVLKNSGRVPEAIEHYEQALRINPGYATAHDNLGTALEAAGRVPEAMGHYEQALRLRPDFAEAHNNLGAALVKQDELQDAIKHFEQALRINPDYAKAHYNLGSALEQAGRLREAVGQYEQALRCDPDLVEARDDLMRLRAAR